MGGVKFLKNLIFTFMRSKNLSKQNKESERILILRFF